MSGIFPTTFEVVLNLSKGDWHLGQIYTKDLLTFGSVPLVLRRESFQHSSHQRCLLEA